MNVTNMIPLKALRVVLEMSSKEFADIFECTPAYITSIEKGDRVMKKQTLVYGLMKLGIKEEQYKELNDFYQNIFKEIKKQEFTKLMLLKTYSVLATTEEEKKQIEVLINIILKSNKSRTK